jgi:rsbT co-antagonist protein RsbR
MPIKGSARGSDTIEPLGQGRKLLIGFRCFSAATIGGSCGKKTPARLHSILRKYGLDVLADWMAELTSGLKNDRRISESELTNQTREFISLNQTASSTADRIDSMTWAPIRDLLNGISRSRVQQGYISDETATFIFSFKKPLFECLRR